MTHLMYVLKHVERLERNNGLSFNVVVVVDVSVIVVVVFFSYDDVAVGFVVLLF